MTKPTHDPKQPPARPEMNGETTRFISLSELKAKEEPHSNIDEPKVYKHKLLAVIAVVIAIGVTSVTIYVKKGSAPSVVIEEEPFEQHRPKSLSQMKNDLGPSQRDSSGSAQQNYFQPNPGYDEGQAAYQNYGSYQEESPDRMPAYAEYDSEPVEAEPMQPQEDYQPPVEDYTGDQ